MCLSVGTSVDAIGSTLDVICEQAGSATQPINRHLDSMEETIKDTFLDFKVDIISAKLSSLEGALTAHFTEVDKMLTQMISAQPLPTSVVPDSSTMQVAVPVTSGDVHGIPALWRQAVEVGMTHPGCFPAATLFLYQPSLSFPASSWYPHQRGDRFPPAPSAHRVHNEEIYAHQK